MVIVWDLHYAPANPRVSKNIAQRIHHTINVNVISCANNLLAMNGNVADSRRKLAHPFIPRDKLSEFLSKLGSDYPDLEPIEVNLFEYLKSMSNNPKSIEHAASGD